MTMNDQLIAGDALPGAVGLYDPQHEKDSCGVAFVADIKGRRSHGFLALPPEFDESRRYPVLVLIHGGHASMWRDAISVRWNYHLLSRPGFVLVAPEYRGSVGHGIDFTLGL